MSTEAGRIPPGKVVTWTSTSGGYATTKRGVVYRFVPRGEKLPCRRWCADRDATLRADPDIPDDTAWRRIRTGSERSGDGRYLVRVAGPDLWKHSDRWYGPTASVVEEQNPDARIDP